MYQKWIIRRLKGLGATDEELLDVYYKQVRSVLELAVPVWEPALTKQEARQIERIQRCALHIILGDRYQEYSNALNTLGCVRLSTRRVILCEKFGRKAANSPKYSTWFSLNTAPPPSVNTRRKNKNHSKYIPVQTRTVRYNKSPIPYLTELLNNMK